MKIQFPRGFRVGSVDSLDRQVPRGPQVACRFLLSLAVAGVLSIAMLGGAVHAAPPTNFQAHYFCGFTNFIVTNDIHLSVPVTLTNSVETNWITDYTKTYPGVINGWPLHGPTQHQHALIISNLILNVQWNNRNIPVTVEKHDISPNPPIERDWNDPDFGIIKCNL